MLRLPYVYGDTPEVERLRLFQQFQHNPKCKTIFISKVKIKNKNKKKIF
jgi:DNA excision repair protein ERCC-3